MSKCNFYDGSSQAFLVNLSPWNNIFQGESISLDQLNSIKSELEKDFIVGSNSDLVNAIEAYLNILTTTTGSDYSSIKSSLHDIISDKPVNNKPTQIKEEEIKSSQSLGGGDFGIKTDGSGVNTDDSENAVEIAEKEVQQELNIGKRTVDYSSKVKSTSDLSNIFQTNEALLSRFTSKLNQDYFRISFIDYTKGKIVKTINEINENMAEYKQELADTITDFLGIPKITLYPSDSFNLNGYNQLISAIEDYYEKNNPTDRLSNINNRLFTNLSKSDQDFINTYYAYISLTNFDNLVNLFSNGTVTVNPRYLGAISTEKSLPKYLPYTQNSISSTFFGKSDLDVNIERETSTITKAVITNIPRIKLDGERDGLRNLTVQEFNAAVNLLSTARAKSLIPNLKNTHINPVKTYLNFFNQYFKNKGSLNQLKRIGLFDSNQLEVLKSIYETIINPNNPNSLYSIILREQTDTDFNYLLDILAYINKQGPYEYLSYKYNPETKEYDLETLSDARYSSILRNYEVTTANVIHDLHNNNLWNKILKSPDGFNIKVDTKNRTASITIRSKDNPSTIIISTDTKDSSLRNWDFPTPDQCSLLIKGESISPEIDKGFQIFELLQYVTGLPFKNSNGQLYYRLRESYPREENLKKQLLNFLFNSLEAATISEEISNEERDLKDGEKYTPTEYKNRLAKYPRFTSLASKRADFNRQLDNPSHNPRILVSKSDKGSRSELFLNIVDALSIINGDNNVSVYRNSDGDNIPAVGLMNLVKTLPDFVEIVRQDWDEKSTKNPQLKNIFSSNILYNNMSLITGTVLKTEFVDENGQVIQKNKFNIPEYTTSSIILDFYKNLVEGKDVLFLPTVYADKANQSLIRISKDIQFNGKSLLSCTAEDIEIDYRNSQHTFYTNLLNNLFNTYYKIGQKLGIELLPNINTSGGVGSRPAKVAENIKKINDMLSTRTKDVQSAVIELQSEAKQNGETFEWINETHYSMVDGKLKINPFIEKSAEIFKVSTTSDKAYNDFIKRSLDNFKNDLSRNRINIDTDFFKFLQSDGIAKRFITPDGYLQIVDVQGNLNPIFNKFFFFDGYMSSQFMQITAGEPYNHPSKLKGVKFEGNEDNFYIQDHAARLIAQYKRMVMMQGTIHNYFQGAIEGTGSKLNVAVIKDTSAFLSTPSGKTEAGDALDGSMACTGWQNVLENNSMFSSTAGQNRKNFGFNLDSITGAPTLFKCASFAIDNYECTKSPEKIELLQKMTDRPWSLPLNLMRDYIGRTRNLKDVVKEDLYYEDLEYGGYKKIVDIISKGDNRYDILVQPVNRNGENDGQAYIIPNQLIDTNFKLWKVLGGENSMSLNTTNPAYNYLEPSNASINAVANFISKTGILLSNENLNYYRNLGYNFTDKNIFPFNEDSIVDNNSDIYEDGKYKVILTQDYIYQPMKYSDIHYAVNSSAIKVGARNVNLSTVRSPGNTDPLQYFTIGSQYFGIQMNPDHHADDSRVTESTQIISTLACNGFTRNLASRVYNALGEIVDLTLKDYLKAQGDANTLRQYIENTKIKNKTEIYKILTRSLLKSLSTDNNTDMTLTGYLNAAAAEFTNNLNREFNTADFKYKIPFSAGSIYSKFMTMLASRMNSDSIRRTFGGMGAVMKPSYGYVKYYHFDGNEGFKDTSGKPIRLIGTYTYKDLQRAAIRTGYRVTNGDSTSPIDKFLSTGELRPIIPVNQVKFGDIIDIPEIINGVVQNKTLHLNTYEAYKEFKDNYKEGKNVILRKDIRQDLRPLNISFKFKDEDRLYSIYDLLSVQQAYELNDSYGKRIKKSNNPYEVQTLKQELKQKLLQLKYQTNQALSELQAGISLNGRELEFVNVDPAEVVLSKNYKTKFLLESGDSISEILRDGVKFFSNKLSIIYKQAENELKGTQYDAALLNPLGANSLIIIDDGSEAKQDLISTLEEIPVNRSTVINDQGLQETWRLDDNNKRLYRIEGLKFYKNPKSKVAQEIVVIPSNNIGALANISKDPNYTGVYYNLTGNFETISKALNTVDADLVRDLNLDPESTEFGDEIKRNYTKITQNKINKKAKRMLRSFKESLNITANRIPAQTFQSIMTMKVIDFTDSEANEVYVAASQTILQGSDYDIDKAYITLPFINQEGVYSPWSKIFRYDTHNDVDYFEWSKKLPYPDFDSYTNQYYFTNEPGPFDYSLDVSGILNTETDPFIATVKILNAIEDFKSTDQYESRAVQNSIDISSESNDSLGRSLYTNAATTEELIEYLNSHPDLIAAIHYNGGESWLENCTGNEYYIERLIEAYKQVDYPDTKRIALTYQGVQNLNPELIDQVEELILRHNEPISSETALSEGSKNFIFNSIYSITNDLRNHVAAYSPVSMEAPQEAAAKSAEGERVKKLTNFCPTTKYSLVQANMCGKDDIGISAVGQKVFLACTQYFNTELQKLISKAGGVENITRDMLIRSNIFFINVYNIYRNRVNEKGENIEIPIKVIANTLANITSGDPVTDVKLKRIFRDLDKEYDIYRNPEEQQEIIERLAAREFEEDQSIVISALISSSTDNAKELILDKINANPELMGTYIYLITQGMDFSDISDLMTSDLLYKIKSLVNSNRMYGSSNNIDKVIKNVEDGLSLGNYVSGEYFGSIKLYLRNLKKKGKIEGEMGNKNNNLSTRQMLKNLTTNDITTILHDLEDPNVRFTKIQQIDPEFAEEFDIFDFYDEAALNRLAREQNEVKKQFIRFLEDSQPYKEIQGSLKKQKNKDLFNTFKKAYDGAKELTALGRVFGLNGGMKTDLYDRYSFSKVFNDILQEPLSSMKEMLSADIVDPKSEFPNFFKYCTLDTSTELAISNFNFSLERFMEDKNYRLGIKELYEPYKKLVNFFDIIYKLPHYNAFIRAYITNEKNQRLSSLKYGLLEESLSHLELVLGKRSSGFINKLSKKQFNDLSNYIDEVIVSHFLSDSNRSITLQSGDKYFSQGKLVEAIEPTVIRLNSDDAFATFKYYMENKVIPYLRNGQTIARNGQVITVSELTNNDFLNRLTLTQEKHPITGVPYNYYRSAVNLLNSDNNIEFDKQVTAFTAIENVTFEGISLSDLFLTYDLIVNKGKKKQGSILKILSGSVFNNTSLISQYFQYIGEVDYNTAEEGVKYNPNSPKITFNDINFDDLSIKLAPRKDTIEERASRLGYVKVYNRDTDLYTINKVSYDVLGGKIETPITLNIDPNYYLLTSNINSNFVNQVPDINSGDIISLIQDLVKVNKIKILLEC